MNDIEKMKEYLNKAEANVDTVYHSVQTWQKGSVSNQLICNMNHISNIIHTSRGLLDKLAMPKKEMIEKLEIAQGLLSSVYHNACGVGDREIETAMSVADGCISDAMSKLEK